MEFFILGVLWGWFFVAVIIWWKPERVVRLIDRLNKEKPSDDF